MTHRVVVSIMGSESSKRKAQEIVSGVLGFVLGKTITGMITGIGGAAKNAENLEREIKRQKDLDEVKFITSSNAIQYFPNLAERDLGVLDTSIYSTSNIKQALGEGRIPPSYSLTLLEDIGFGPEVKSFRDGVDGRRKSSLRKVGDTIDILIKHVRDEVARDTQTSRQLASLGVDESLLSELDEIAKEAAAGEIVNSTIVVLNSLFASIAGALAKSGGLVKQDHLGTELVNRSIDAFQERLLGLNRVAILREGNKPVNPLSLSRPTTVDPSELTAKVRTVGAVEEFEGPALRNTNTLSNIGF